MRRKQGRLKPGGLYFNPTRSDGNTADKDANTGDNKDINTGDNKDTNTGDNKDTNIRDKDSNTTKRDAEERDTNAGNKDARSLVNVIGREKILSYEDKPLEMGKTRNMRKTHSTVNKQDLLVEGRERDSSKTEDKVSPSEDPDSLPQVCLGSIHSRPSVGPSIQSIHEAFLFFRPFVGPFWKNNCFKARHVMTVLKPLKAIPSDQMEVKR